MPLTCPECPWWQASQSAQHSVTRAQQDGWRKERGYSLVRAAKGGRLLNLRRKQEQHTQALPACAATQILQVQVLPSRHGMKLRPVACPKHSTVPPSPQAQHCAAPHCAPSSINNPTPANAAPLSSTRTKGSPLTRMPTRWCSGFSSTSGWPSRMGTREMPSRVAASGSSMPASSTQVGAKSTLPTCRQKEEGLLAAVMGGETGAVKGNRHGTRVLGGNGNGVQRVQPDHPTTAHPCPTTDVGSQPPNGAAHAWPAGAGTSAPLFEQPAEQDSKDGQVSTSPCGAGPGRA